MNNQFIQLTNFLSREPFLVNVNKIVTIDPYEGEGNAKITTCLNLSCYTVETVEEIQEIIKGKTDWASLAIPHVRKEDRTNMEVG